MEGVRDARKTGGHKAGPLSQPAKTSGRRTAARAGTGSGWERGGGVPAGWSTARGPEVGGAGGGVSVRARPRIGGQAFPAADVAARILGICACTRPSGAELGAAVMGLG